MKNIPRIEHNYIKTHDYIIFPLSKRSSQSKFERKKQSNKNRVKTKKIRTKKNRVKPKKSSLFGLF